MRTMNEWRQIFLQDVADMRGLERPYGVFPKTPTSKRVQEIGWHCYQVEEHLSILELQQLKHELEIDEIQWRKYKTEVSANLHPNLLTRIRFLFTQRGTLQDKRDNESSSWLIPLPSLASWIKSC
jgi:hypothetical protein